MLFIFSGKEFKMRDKIKKKKRRGTHVKKPKKNKYTLNQLGMTVDKLAKIVNDGFTELRQDVNSLKQDVEGLRQDVKSISTRLDKVEKRLDYNDLKQLPTSNK